MASSWVGNFSISFNHGFSMKDCSLNWNHFGSRNLGSTRPHGKKLRWKFFILCVSKKRGIQMLRASRNPWAVKVSCKRRTGLLQTLLLHVPEGYRGYVQATNCVRDCIVGESHSGPRWTKPCSQGSGAMPRLPDPPQGLAIGRFTKSSQV